MLPFIHWLIGIGLLVDSGAGVLAEPLPDPMPNGHVNRDIQILVEDRQITVDVRMAATDFTWLELIRLAESRTNQEALQQSGAISLFSGASKETEPVQPLPTVETDVAAWLQHSPNRQMLEKWFASHCRAQWGGATLLQLETVSSRSDSLHHWAVVYQLKYQIQPGVDAGSLAWHQTPFTEYPGKVRRAIKTRGESMIDSTDVSPLVVRAEFELKTEDHTAAEREESIVAELRLPTR